MKNKNKVNEAEMMANQAHKSIMELLSEITEGSVKYFDLAKSEGIQYGHVGDLHDVKNVLKALRDKVCKKGEFGKERKG